MRKAAAILLVTLSFLGGLALEAQTQLTAAVGLALPPYVLKDTKKRTRGRHRPARPSRRRATP